MFNKLRSFLWNNRAAVSIYTIVMGMVGLVVAAYLAASMLPSSIAQLATTANWTSAGVPATSPVIPLGTIVAPILIIVVFILLIVGMVRKHGD